MAIVSVPVYWTYLANPFHLVRLCVVDSEMSWRRISAVLKARFNLQLAPEDSSETPSTAPRPSSPLLTASGVAQVLSTMLADSGRRVAFVILTTLRTGVTATSSATCCRLEAAADYVSNGAPSLRIRSYQPSETGPPTTDRYAHASGVVRRRSPLRTLAERSTTANMPVKVWRRTRAALRRRPSAQPGDYA